MSNRGTLGERKHVALVTMLLFVLSASHLLAGEEKLTFHDFNWTFKEMRSATSVERERPGVCISIAGDNVEFKAEEEGKPFSIIGLTLKAKRNGVVNLIPEFFLARDGLQYHVCRGVRIVKPKPNPRAEAFFPPYDARVWPGHAGDRRIVKAGDAIDIELLFDHIWREDSEILAAVPVAPLRMQSGNTEDAQPESGPVRK